MNKPLTPEEREEALRVVEVFNSCETAKMCAFFGADLALAMVNGILNLTAAEAFWREHFAKTDPTSEFAECEHCGMKCGFAGEPPPSHAPDCPWLLAQNS